MLVVEKCDQLNEKTTFLSKKEKRYKKQNKIKSVLKKFSNIVYGLIKVPIILFTKY